MRKIMLALTLALTPMLAACGREEPAAATPVEINVLSVGLVGGGFQKVVDAWSAKTGNTVNLPVPLGPLGVIVAAIDTQPADVIILPVADLATQADKFQPGSTRDIGRVQFSLGARENDTVTPDLSSEEALRAALASKGVMINDPATSLNGRMVKEVLDRPGYETVRVVPRPGNSALQLAATQEADYVISVLPEQLVAPGVKVVGTVPDSLGLRIDFGAGIAAKATQADAARDFLEFLAGPEAQEIWKANGVAVPIPQ